MKVKTKSVDVDSSSKAVLFSEKLFLVKKQEIKKARKNVGCWIALQVSLELVITTAVGGGVGWLVDNWIKTPPWFMVLFLFFGSIAGVINTYRIKLGLSESVGFFREGAARK